MRGTGSFGPRDRRRKQRDEDEGEGEDEQRPTSHHRSAVTPAARTPVAPGVAVAAAGAGAHTAPKRGMARAAYRSTGHGINAYGAPFVHWAGFWWPADSLTPFPIAYEARPGTRGFPGGRVSQEHDFLGARASSPRGAAPPRLRGQDARAPRRPRSREAGGIGLRNVRKQDPVRGPLRVSRRLRPRFERRADARGYARGPAEGVTPSRCTRAGPLRAGRGECRDRRGSTPASRRRCRAS